MDLDHDLMRVDCQGCPVRGVACGDCMVTALLDPSSVEDPGASTELPLDRSERAAVGRLVAAGLVSAETATAARARREPWSEWELVRDAVG